MKGLLEVVKKLLFQPIFLVFLLFVLSGVSIYSISKYRSVSSELASIKGDTETITEDEIKDLEKKVRKLTELPEGELPTIATVTDVDSIDQNQQFFQNAKNGDKVLIYTQSRRAILYRPDIDKIIEIAPINLGQQEEFSPDVEVVTNETEESKKLVRLAVYDGAAAEDSVTEQIVNDLTLDISEVVFDVVARLDANGEYEDTVVVVLSGGFEDEAARIVEVLGGSVSTVPEDELIPEADILLILGKSLGL